MKAEIVSIWRLESTYNSFEDAVLKEIIEHGGVMPLSELESISILLDRFGPINFGSIGFPGMDKLLKPRMFRMVLDGLASRGLITIEGDTVRVTPQGRIVAQGVKSIDALLGVPSVLEVVDEHYILYPGIYMLLLSTPPEHDSLVVPECEIGIHSALLPAGKRVLLTHIPVKLLLPVKCRVRYLPVQ